MADRYDFGNLSPIEFEGLCVDLLEAETGLRFERFAEGSDDGMDGRHTRADGDIIAQAKHYKGSTWSDLKVAAKKEAKKLVALNPAQYYFLTSQPLSPERKNVLVGLLAHPSVTASRIRGRTEINAMLIEHPLVERQTIKLWISSASVLRQLLTHDISIQTKAYTGDIDRVLKVYVANPSLVESRRILAQGHNLIISGPPGVGKTTLSQVIAAELVEAGYQLTAIGSIEDGHRAFADDDTTRQLFIFDDFLGKIRLDEARLAGEDTAIVRFMNMVRKDPNKRFILTTRAYIWHGALTVSEAFDDRRVRISEIVLNLDQYTRELKARILYNHLYHSEIDPAAIAALLEGSTIRRIVDHPNYMPRIIEWMTDDVGRTGIDPLAYPEHFLDGLAHPNEIWKKPFRQHISEAARVLLYCTHFSEPIGYSDAALSVSELEAFFENAVVRFGVVPPGGYRAALFEDTMRELKSSFVKIDRDRLDYVNPSVQDFLAGEAMDDNVIRAMASAVPRWKTAMRFWKTVRHAPAAPIIKDVARVLLKRVVDGQLEGSIALHDLTMLIANLVIVTQDHEALTGLRKAQTPKVYWILESKLPTLIETFETGLYSHLPNARGFARHLRRVLYRYLAEERDEAFEPGELADLAEGLIDAHIEMPDAFVELFDEAVEEVVDLLDLHSIPRDSDPGPVIEEWIEHLDAIGTYTSSYSVISKKRQLEQHLGEIAHAEDLMMEERHFAAPRLTEPSEPAGQGRSRPGAGWRETGFTDANLSEMFSSLRKPE